MQENGNILKVLTQMLGQQGQMITQQKAMVTELQVMRKDITEVRKDITEVRKDITEVKRLNKRHGDILMHILEALEDDIPKYDELIEMETVKGNKVVLRKTK